MNKVETFIDNPWTKLIARLAMFVTPMIVAYIGQLTLSYLEAKFDDQARMTATVSQRVDHLETTVANIGDQTNALTTRLAVVESNQTVSVDRTQKIQDTISAKLDNISSDITTVKEKVAAIGAKVDLINQKAN